MKKLYYFIPHLILIALLVNKKITDKKQMAAHNDSRHISSFSEENHLSKKNTLLKVQNPEKFKIPARKLSMLNKNFFNQFKLPEESGERVIEFSLSTEKSVLLPNYFNSSFSGDNSPTKNSIIRGLNPTTTEGSHKILVREL